MPPQQTQHAKNPDSSPLKSSLPSPALTKQVLHREQIFIDPFKGPTVLSFIKACTLWNIYPTICFFALFSTMIVLIDAKVERLRLPSTILTVLGTVIGFVISYRTSSAYERYTDGRKQWANIIHVGRTLARLVWLHCPYPIRVPAQSSPATDAEKINGILEKKTFINLIEGFAVSLKHYLRGEHGIYYEDLYHLACFLPKYAFPAGHPIDQSELESASESYASSQVENIEVCIGTGEGSFGAKNEALLSIKKGCGSMQPPPQLSPAYNPPAHKITERFPFHLFRSMWKGARNATGSRSADSYRRRVPDDNIPLEIIWSLDSYVAALQERKTIDPPTTTALLTGIHSLSDSLTGLERILTTPVPFGYIVHLKIVIWVYLLFLPSQLLSTFGYNTIPAVTLVAIAFLGFLQVGQEIENPFGYDSNDLDMDHFCHSIISRELAEMTSMPPPNPNVFMYSFHNMPLLGQKETRSAPELAQAYTDPAQLQALFHTRRKHWI